jgi:hypothetical protein
MSNNNRTQTIDVDEKHTATVVNNEAPSSPPKEGASNLQPPAGKESW